MKAIYCGSFSTAFLSQFRTENNLINSELLVLKLHWDSRSMHSAGICSLARTIWANMFPRCSVGRCLDRCKCSSCPYFLQDHNLCITDIMRHCLFPPAATGKFMQMLQEYLFPLPDVFRRYGISTWRFADSKQVIRFAYLLHNGFDIELCHDRQAFWNFLTDHVLPRVQPKVMFHPSLQLFTSVSDDLPAFVFD